MSMSSSKKSECASGRENKATSICAGCLQTLSSKGFTEHRQELSRQLDQIQQKRFISVNTQSTPNRSAKESSH